VRIDFVSDVSCPWCAIGLASLEQALARLDGIVDATIHVQPFELNAAMPPGGEDADEHLQRKYGSTAEQRAQSREAIRRRGAELGFTFNRRERIYNTFDAHRLLHWAGETDPARQLALKRALLRACFTDGADVSDHAILARLAGEAGLDPGRAQRVMASDEFAAAVRERERYYTDRGIHAVPAIILNERHLISGGQPVDVFENALRRISHPANLPA
jgi:predicted DsbA family dithiol-disulfide isomerase